MKAAAKILLGGTFVTTCFDRNGKLKWIEKSPNIVVGEGLDHVLSILLKNGTVIDPWYVFIFENNYTPLTGDTYAAHGWTESTAYTQANRPEFVDGAIAGHALDNSASKAVFSINATKTIYGAGLCGGGGAPNTKADTAGGGKVLCASKFLASKNVESGDTLNVQYTFGAADDGV